MRRHFVVRIECEARVEVKDKAECLRFTAETQRTQRKKEK